MSKIKHKTHSGLKKRIKVSANGKLMRHKAYSNHLAASKTTKQNRQLAAETTVDKTDAKRIKRLISNMM
ncbi:50S ribosomal protein L35 [Acholeplasma equifetale]|uniref:50S ribosomal protein L35 n=1 Tax=Acholeplasma equifetale TaxID=264634 RepID=UPI00047B5C91|nr:50S ribosomal protein L35 [Acholeplasma equifetale]